MKKFDFQPLLRKLLPPGIEFRGKESRLIAGMLIFSGLWSLQIPHSYRDARSSLFYWSSGTGILRPEARMVPFETLLFPGMLYFPLAVLFLAGLGLSHWRYHRQDSMSVYLMKRLPDPREYYIRLWGIPALGLLLEGLLTALLLLIYYGIYLLFTPAQCL